MKRRWDVVALSSVTFMVGEYTAEHERIPQQEIMVSQSKEVAFLVAAAPDMHEALKRERDWWMEEMANCTGQDAVDRANRRLDAIQEALFKVGKGMA